MHTLARKIMRVADKHSRTQELTMSELYTFLPGTVHEPFLRYLQDGDRRLLTQMDQNHDGTISLAELLDMVHGFLAGVDPLTLTAPQPPAPSPVPSPVKKRRRPAAAALLGPGELPAHSSVAVQKPLPRYSPGHPWHGAVNTDNETYGWGAHRELLSILEGQLEGGRVDSYGPKAYLIIGGSEAIGNTADVAEAVGAWCDQIDARHRGASHGVSWLPTVGWIAVVQHCPPQASPHRTA